MKWVIAFLGLLLLALQFRLWVGEGSFADVARLRQAVAAQQAQNRDLEQRNAALSAEVSDLRSGLAAVAELARTQLGMIGPDETFYQVVGRASGAAAPSPETPPAAAAPPGPTPSAGAGPAPR